MNIITNDIYETQYSKTLETLFMTDFQTAIKESQNLICSISGFNSYDSFLEFNKKHALISTCQNEWREHRMAIHCFDCSLDAQSCLCLSCFLNGNHEGHNYAVRPCSIGNCDCGDLTMCKSSGFCTKHKGLENNDKTDDCIDEKLRNILTDVIFKSSFLALKKLSTKNEEFWSPIINFLSSFLQFGDGFRRLISISLTEKFDFEDFLRNIVNYNIDFNKSFQKFCGNLVNDQVFKDHFSTITYKLMLEKFIKLSFQALNKQVKEDNYATWNNFFYHAFSPPIVQFNALHKNWDWVSFGIQFSSYLKSFFSLIGDPNYTKTIPSYLSDAVNCFSSLTKIQPIEQTQLFFDRFFNEVLCTGSDGFADKNNTILPVSFKDSQERMLYFPVMIFNLMFYPIFNCFKSKKNLKIDAMIDKLNKVIDISPIFLPEKNLLDCDENENDDFALEYIKFDSENSFDYPDYYYQSFHNGASFFFSLPLCDSFVQLFNLDNEFKFKIGEFLLKKEYQSLRIKLGIITLKKILSFVCYQQSLVPKDNFNLDTLILNYSNSPVVASLGVSKYFPLLQVLVGLQSMGSPEEHCLKEFFAFEMAREFGVFDDYKMDNYYHENIEEKSEQILFCFMYFSILLVVERILFAMDKDLFIQEQLIAAFKKGVTTSVQLNNSFDRDIFEDSEVSAKFYSVIQKIATPKIQTNEEPGSNQDISYILNDAIKWNAVSAIIPLGDQKTFLNNEINKHNDELIKIQDFTSEESSFYHSSSFIENNKLNINLKDFLLTPTVFAVVYHSFRNSKNELNNCSLNNHFALNILVLISRFLKEKPNFNQENSLEEKVTICYSTIPELVLEFKKIISDTFNNKDFAILLKMKISYENYQPLSFFDLIQEIGKVGTIALNEISDNLGIELLSNLNDNNKQTKENKKDLKKKRANHLKDEIMNHYKTLISNYNVTESSSAFGTYNSFASTSRSGLLNIEGESCSICSTNKKDEALSYPIFIYQTKLPFILDKPPEGKEGEKLGKLIEVTCDDDALFENYVEDEEISNDSVENDEDIRRYVVQENQSINNLLQETISERDSGELFGDELASRFQLIATRKQNLIAQMQYKQQQYCLYKFKVKQKELYNQKLRDFEENGYSPIGRRFTAGANFIIQFQICQHLCHPSCIDQKLFNCPIDRSIKNAFLPALEIIKKPALTNDKDKSQQISDSLSLAIKNSIQTFINNFKSFISNDLSKPMDVFVELIKSISGLITIFEVRLRSLPDCLDSNNWKILSRNLFLSTWYAYRIQGKPKMTNKIPYKKLSFLSKDDSTDDDVELRLTEFQKFIKKLIECDDIEDSDKGIPSFQQITDSFVNSSAFKKSTNQRRNEKELCLFLRRVELSDYFLLDNQNITLDENPHPFGQFVDWDELLSAQSLSEKYHVKFSTLNGEDFEFKPFAFAKLPKEFLRLSQPPYNFPIETTNKYSMLNLLNYNTMIERFNDFDDTEDATKNDDVEKKIHDDLECFEESSYEMPLIANFGRRHYPTPFLLLGKNASKVLISYKDNQNDLLKPFYLDKYGSTDIGFKREQPLFLNDERYERFVDEVLSGAFFNITDLQ